MQPQKIIAEKNNMRQISETLMTHGGLLNE